MELQISSAELQGGGGVKKGKLKTTFFAAQSHKEIYTDEFHEFFGN